MAAPPDPCLVAAGVPPYGQSSNFIDPPSLAPVLKAIMSILIAWATIFVAVRFYVNIRKLKLSDYLSLLALLMSIAITGVEFTQLRVARHIWDVPVCFFDTWYAQSIYITAILLTSGKLCAQTSIFLLFLQVFAVKDRLRLAIWTGVALTILLYTPGIVVSSYYETPRPGETWLYTMSVRALIPLKWWQAQSAMAVALDLYIFILPIKPVYELQMPLRKRLTVLAVFSLALMGVAASVGSLVERVHITRTTDTTWVSTILTLCSAVELNVAIIVGCTPYFANFTRLTYNRLISFRSLLHSYFSGNDSTDDLEAVLNLTEFGEKKASTVSNVIVAKYAGPEQCNDDVGEGWRVERSVTVETGSM